MIMERIERIDTKTEGLEAIKRFFVNPEDPESAEDLTRLSSNSIIAMAQIYATGGNINEMTPNIKEWLTDPLSADDRLEQQVGEILKRECKTRRFDNRFMGQIHPQGSKIGILSNLIAAYMNTNRIYKGVSPAEAEMEADSIKWLSEIFGYDTEKSGGNITTGGTTANIEALWVAREKALISMDINARKVRQPLYVLVSKWRHYSIDKACNMLCLRLITVPDDGCFKIDTKALDKRANAIQKAGGKIAAMIGIAGETETGMIEDLNGIADIAEKYNAFFHVDAAYGGPYVLSNAKEKFQGINRADSIVVDPHKMLYTPYSAGSVLFKDEADHLLISKVHSTRYLRNVVARVEGSMGSGGVIATWATKEMFGKEGIATLLNNTLELTDYTHGKLEASKILRPIFKPELNTILVGLKPELELSVEENNQIMAKIEDLAEEVDPGTIYISRNQQIDNGKDTLRFLAVHPFTTTNNIDELITFLENEVESQLQLQI